ncbi:MAG: methionine biosynthesis protein MetW [Chloroflexota bacterium]|nr:methionine biosynthesis protein MetW [Chloroflexota bacterium]
MDFEAFYDDYWQHQGDTFDKRRQRLLLEHIGAGDRVLQVDCGPGVLAARMVQMGADVEGTDLSAEAVRRSRARGITTHQVNVDSGPLPFSDGSFDVVVTDSQIEHRVDYAHYLDESVRVLRGGNGRLIMCVPNTAHWRVRWWLLRGRFPIVEHTPTDWLHLRFFTLHELRALLKERGVVLEHVGGSASLWVEGLYPNWLRRNTSARVYESLARLRPTLFARDLIIVGRKEQ